MRNRGQRMKGPPTRIFAEGRNTPPPWSSRSQSRRRLRRPHGPAGSPATPLAARLLYQACQDCHSLDKNDVGPRHRGVFGRKAASLPDYDYSDALKSANIVWNEETLDKWLTDPQAVAPGAKMFFHLDNPQDRADVIAYLKERAK